MLNLTTALGRNGLQDWLLQRLSALILVLYVFGLLLFWLLGHPSPAKWQTLFNLLPVRLATAAAFLGLLAHAWIGMWVIYTDYLKNINVRILALIFTYCFLLFDFIWCWQILWG